MIDATCPAKRSEQTREACDVHQGRLRSERERPPRAGETLLSLASLGRIRAREGTNSSPRFLQRITKPHLINPQALRPNPDYSW